MGSYCEAKPIQDPSLCPRHWSQLICFLGQIECAFSTGSLQAFAQNLERQFL